VGSRSIFMRDSVVSQLRPYCLQGNPPIYRQPDQICLGFNGLDDDARNRAFYPLFPPVLF